METLLILGLMAAGLLLFVVAGAWGWLKIVELDGSMSIWHWWQPTMIAAYIRHWPYVKKSFFLQLAGVALILLAYFLGRQSGIFPP